VAERVVSLHVGIRELTVMADIGVNAHEIGRRQPLIVTACLWIDPVTDDAIDATIDYRDVRAAPGVGLPGLAGRAAGAGDDRQAAGFAFGHCIGHCDTEPGGCIAGRGTVDTPQDEGRRIMVIAAPPSRSIASLLADRPMSRPQIWAVALSVALNALDGFDVLAITFAAPGISKAWGIGPAQLGIALSSGLVGMTAGSLLLAPLGDRLGRRPLILGCLLLMALGMALTATATGIYSLCVWRVLTGLGIGGMVAAINGGATSPSR
jgi:hypothetical protein